jgi:hypothetical protein
LYNFVWLREENQEVDKMKRKYLLYLTLLGLLVNVATSFSISTLPTTALETKQIDGPPYYDWTFSINSSKNGLVTWTSAEFMALDNLTGWGQQLGYDAPVKYKGVNFTWLLVNYGDYGEGLVYKVIEITGFLASKPHETIINNATHCHIIAYEYNDRVMDSEFVPRIVPVALTEGENIRFIGNQHPRHIEIVQVIGASENTASELAMIQFVMIFSTAVAGVGALIFGVSYYFSKRKAT